LPGFQWLTHVVDYDTFPDSLLVVWVFDTDAHLAQAIAADEGAYMLELTAEALNATGVQLDNLASHVAFDSEQACSRSHGGNWEARLRARNRRLH